jgi:AsmA protein
MKRALKILGIVIAILIVIVIALPFFIDANIFRPRLESELTEALGRQVKVGNLSLSLLSGGVTADDISIADDPAFSSAPFVKANSLKVGVQLLPLIFSKSLEITDLTLNGPQINLVRSQDGERWNFSSLGNKSAPAAREAAAESARANEAAQRSESTKSAPSAKPAPSTKSGQPAPGEPASNPNLSVAKLAVTDGRLTVSRANSEEKQRVYDKVKIQGSNFSFTSSFPFSVTANLPQGGRLKLDGHAGPVNSNDTALTPLEAKVSIQQMDLAASGFIDPASGIAGIADLDGTVNSNGHEAKANGTLKASKLQVVKKGSPAGKPVEVQFAVVDSLVKQTGDITRGDVSMGRAVAHLTGTYNAHGKVTEVNLKLNGDGMPVDDLEAMLPAVGVILPEKSQLRGGTLAVHLTSAGPVDKLVSTGSVKLENSALAGFNLTQKLSEVSRLTGKSVSGNDTAIQNFSADVRNAPEGTQLTNINLSIPAFGVLTGNGTISPSNELNFKMAANLSGGAVTGLTQLAGLGNKGGTLPFMIEGTTQNPRFVPDVKGMAGSALQQALQGNKGQKNPASDILGLFKKKPQ